MKKVDRCLVKYNRRHCQSGFTLIEVMVVIVIIAILAAIIVPRVMQRPEQAKQVAAKQDILAIQDALELYKLDNGDYPTTEQGLSALARRPTIDPTPMNWQAGGYLHSLPKDPWSHPYHYQNPGEHGEIDIYSMGSKNDDTTVIGNWSEEQSADNGLQDAYSNE